MARNWGRTPVSNADKRHATQAKYLVRVGDGTEERIDRRPMGKVERFVDNDGGVVSLQMYSDGDAKRYEAEIRRRADLHKKGFVEFAKCPLKHGTRNSSPQSTKDFAKMTDTALVNECNRDPKVMERIDGDLYAGRSCPHIEWLIKFRRERSAAAYEKRNAALVANEKRDKERRELDALELEEKRERLGTRAR